MTCVFSLAGRTNLCVPDVDALVEGAAGEVPAVGAEGHAVDGLLVAGQSVDAHAALHVPQTHRGVKRRAAEIGMTSKIRFDPTPSQITRAAAWRRADATSPGQHETRAGVVGARSCRTPLDGVDLFTVGLQVVDARVLLHTPDLVRTQTANRDSAQKTSEPSGLSQLGAFFSPSASCHRNRRPTSCR